MKHRSTLDPATIRERVNAILEEDGWTRASLIKQLAEYVEDEDIIIIILPAP